MIKKIDSVKELRNHLSKMFETRHVGTLATTYAKRQGFIDGYMQAMLDLLVIDDAQLLKIVTHERSAAAKKSQVNSSKIPDARQVENFA